MLRRCTDPKCKDWKYYGARGIPVCRRWQRFSAFLTDMGPRPEGATLHRLDGSRGYTPGNCVWATRAVQSFYRRGPKLTHRQRVQIRRLLAGGVTQREVASRFGISVGYVAVLRYGGARRGARS